jgi:hypothetical protein
MDGQKTVFEELVERVERLEQEKSPIHGPDNGGIYNKLDFLRLLIEVNGQINVQHLLKEATNKLHSQLFKEEN